MCRNLLKYSNKLLKNILYYINLNKKDTYGDSETK